MFALKHIRAGAVLIILTSLTLGVSAQAQSSRCDNLPTEEEYQKCIERAGSDVDYDPSDFGVGSAPGTVPEPAEQTPKVVDTLPRSSQKHVRQEMAKKVYAKVGKWTPEARNMDFDYEPSPAAKEDAELRAEEEAAFAAMVEDYHNREEMAANQAGNAGQSGAANAGQGTQTAQGSGNTSVRGTASDTGQAGETAGNASGAARSAMDILGDLTVTGNAPAQTASQSPPTGSPGQEGQSQDVAVIDGDVTIDRSSGASAQAKPSAEQAGSDQSTPAREAIGSAQNSQQRVEGGAVGNDQAPQKEMASESNEARSASSAQAAETPDTPEPQQGMPSQTSSSNDQPPQTSPRPIPAADPTSAAILADLFGGGDQSDSEQDDIFSDAPFVDWSDPSPSSGGAPDREGGSNISQARDAIREDSARWTTGDRMDGGEDAAESQISPARDAQFGASSASAQRRLSFLAMP